MRIALVVPGGVDRSGRERVIPVLLDLIERLARENEVVVFALQQEAEPSRYALLGAEVVNLGSVGGVWGVRYVARLRRLLVALRDRGRFDVLHAIWADGPGRLAVVAGRRLNIPVIISVGGGELVWVPQQEYGGGRNAIQRALLWAALRAADRVTAGSRYALRPCKQWRKDAAWLPLGVVADKFWASPERGGPPWRLLHVATLNAVKDQSTLLRALRLLKDRGIPYHADIVGEDTLHGRIQRLSSELGLDEVVRFHGFLPQDELVPFYRRAHLLLQTSVHESMGAVVLEAAAAGVPTIGTNVGLVAELAPNAAVAVPVGNAAALADAIAAVLADDALRISLATNAQRFARSFDADWTAAEFARTYDSLLPAEVKDDKTSAAHSAAGSACSGR